MYCDLPLLRRCCFCLPLRPGLIAWGYFKMTADMVLIAFACIILSDNKLCCSYKTLLYNTFCIISSLLIIIFLVDAIFALIFLLATHTKNSKLMRSCLYYNTCLYVASNMAFLLFLGYLATYIGSPNYPSFQLIMMALASGLVNAVVQFYIIMLIRSEVRKLNNDYCVKYENNRGDAKCFVNFGNIGNTNMTSDQHDIQKLTEEIHDTCPNAV